ncbi:peroxinectin precursor [Fulvimarina pelagi HTCC2506]|uniref:Peroxinectin n=1 Tax=Fulvimarina pelagi HTCC2506 TaxID=314231 RepID=Q0G343_9HYPH|nr:peroxinectin precursor [Fulvimarina pelagi HTCC2506]
MPTLRELIEHHWEANTIFRDPSLPNGAISFREYFTDFPISEGVTGNLFDEATGAYDPDVVNHLVSDFMGGGYPLLLDTNPFINLLDHYIAGDGRANENFALTSMHTVWARNHNFHVETLMEAGFEGTSEEFFQAAKMLNEAEYQRVVFDEFADFLIGGIRGSGSHGHDEYNPDVDARISHEFAAAVYRVGHSLVGQTMTVIGPDGQPREVALFDASSIRPTRRVPSRVRCLRATCRSRATHSLVWARSERYRHSAGRGGGLQHRRCDPQRPRSDQCRPVLLQRRSRLGHRAGHAEPGPR